MLCPLPGLHSSSGCGNKLVTARMSRCHAFYETAGIATASRTKALHKSGCPAQALHGTPHAASHQPPRLGHMSCHRAHRSGNGSLPACQELCCRSPCWLFCRFSLIAPRLQVHIPELVPLPGPNPGASAWDPLALSQEAATESPHPWDIFACFLAVIA